MESKTSKKKGMALVLILVIITSLAAIVASSMKVLVISNKYSIDRNSKAGSGAKPSGVYICYKMLKSIDPTTTYELSQRRVDYKPDGSIASEKEDKDIKECSFEIPSGVKNIKVTLVGAGSRGSESSATFGYDSYQKCNCGLFDDCNNTDCTIAKGNIKTQKEVNLVFGDPTNCQPNSNCEAKIELSGVNESWYNNALRNATTAYNGNCNSAYIYIDNEQYKKTIPDFSRYDSFQATLKSIFEEFGYYPPKYSVRVGQEGKTGHVETITLDNMYGDSQGGSTLKIKKDNIGEPGNVNTTLEYYVKNSKGEYEKSSPLLTAKGETTTTNQITTVIKSKNLVDINTRYGKLPKGFDIPSILKLNNLTYGYQSGDNMYPATYFGASGASGKIKLDDSIFDKCYKYQYKLSNDSIYTITSSDTICNSPPNFKNIASKGAPGAIMISW